MIKTVRMALRQYWWAVGVIIGAMILSLFVAGYILSQQRFNPLEDTYNVRANFASAQAVTPGQGQAVAVAGVTVGQISKADLVDGQAVVTMKIDRKKLAEVHEDAHVMLRPRTGLQDMTIELDPGSPSRAKIKDGGTLPQTQSTSQVQLDEAVAALDSDTRGYFQQLLQASAEGFKGNAKTFQRILRAAAPTARQTHRVLEVLTERRRALSNTVSRLGSLSQALGQHDQAVGDTLDRAAVTLRTIAGRDRELRLSLQQLPSTLDLTRQAVTKTGELADEVVPTSKALRPAIRDVTAALPDAEPLLRALPRDLAPVRRLAVQGRQPVREIRRTVQQLEPQLADTNTSLQVLQHVTNVLAYDPPGEQKGFSYYLGWFAHNTNSLFSTNDANGAGWRGQLILSCGTISGLAPLRPVTDLLSGLGVCK
ncbi:MlaD family protein [Patulibacter sp.]|uniref:MlaD family protein n=1 Tax=Patulibacter sp. TaxID=1912859 RepID=UPI00271E4533|nr:MlaD family protein [Patulibacter sp.]MDO9410380.1 MlaD family protein [Patulibacter sp.]